MSFKRLTPENVVISTDSIASTMWSNNVPTLTNTYTSSLQVASNTGQFYYDIYNYETSDSRSEVQFQIAYADSKGSGSVNYNPLVNGLSPSRTLYGQYRNIIYGDENANFVFGNKTGSNFYAINIERSRYKEKLLPGSLTLNLSGSGGLISLTDNSLISPTVVFQDSGRLYQLVSGSAGNVYTDLNSNGFTPNSGSYGFLLPDIGIIILNAQALDGADIGVDGGIGLGTSRTSNADDSNPAKVYLSMINASGSANFTINSEETVTSNFFFIRPRSREFNYSENPSFISGSTGAVIYDSFIDNPETYITTVGLYNDNNELLAIAKLSRPLPKNFTEEVLIRAKLDF